MQLLLRPHVDNLPRVLLAEALFESIIVPDVLFSCLELVQRGLEDLNGALFGDIQRSLGSHIGSGAAVCVHNDSLLPRGYDTVDRIQDAAIHQLEQQDTSLGIDRLVCDSSFLLVLNAVFAFTLFDGEVPDLIVDFVGQLKFVANT